MLLLHISDIHFNQDFVANPRQDPDAPIRRQLIRHARDYVASAGRVDAILFTGDIAYRGASKEYDAAKLWLCELADAVQCSRDKIFTVPGNHDVDQHIIKTTVSTHNAQLAIDQAAKIDAVFQRQTSSERSTSELLAPLTAYNAFASEYGCDVKHGRLTWERDLSIDDQTALRLHGIASCLISGVDPDVDRIAGRQYVNRTQIVLVQEDDIIHMTLCHHPPHWFRNKQEVNELLNPSARLQLFGHIHDQQIEQYGQNVRVLAGATVPEYSHGDGQPAYNFIDLSVSPEDWRQLNVEIHQFEWQRSPPLFRPKLTPNLLDVFHYTVPIDRAPGSSPTPSTVQEAPQTLIKPSQTEIMEVIEISVPVASSALDWRHAIDTFNLLPSSVRRDIAVELGVLAVEEFGLKESERENLSITRIRMRSLHKEFQNLVTNRRG